MPAKAHCTGWGTFWKNSEIESIVIALLADAPKIGEDERKMKNKPTRSWGAAVFIGRAG